MEDESGLELSLGLSWGGSSSKSKVKEASSDPKGVENQESKGKQKSDQITQPQENFFTDLAKCSTPIEVCPNDARKNLSPFKRYQELLSNRSIEADDERSGSNKRKLPVEEKNFQNKHENFVDYVDMHAAKKSCVTPLLRDSHVSNTTEDGSTGENEDVAESEAEGPQSWLASQREENTKCSDNLKFNGKSAVCESIGIASKGLRESCLLGKETNPEYGKTMRGIPLSAQPSKVMNVSNPVHGTLPSSSGGLNPSTSVMKLVPIANSERPVAPTENANNMQLTFGYPSVQLPTLEAVSAWTFSSQPLHISSFSSRGQSTGVQNQEHFEDGVKRSQDLAISSTKYALETAPSEEGKTKNYITKANEATKMPGIEGFSREMLAIRPGIAPNLRFGGCGSHPDLPWVSATGQGPNGKTISGVTYKYSENQIKVVCACHGTHMSPEEFARHADVEAINSEASLPTGNTAQS
ncbi:hypothetical protein KSP39_PZI015940 [Platanthera zijinensis]|uniref:Ninja-family protein n=1 Tax=Platanthera zijinensis TaxID=2320716 RepID=A0AAP0B8T7_9ASPA